MKDNPYPVRNRRYIIPKTDTANQGQPGKEIQVFRFNRQTDYPIHHACKPENDSSAPNRDVVMRTPFVRLINDIEFIRYPEINQNRDEQHRD